MKRRALHLTLLDDCVFSRSAATAGAHETLDFIPGATLLGAAAARLYTTLETRDPTLAWRVFHSGAVRFGNGLPTCDGQTPLAPVPLSLHERKIGERAIVRQSDDRYRLRPDHAFNFQHVRALPEAAQPKQLRTGYLGMDGSVIEPKRTGRLKTAVDPDTGRAAQGQLFGYEALVAGQAYIACLDADDDIDDAILDEILAALTGTLQLGRSRSAEYGRVQAEPLGAAPAFPIGGTGDTLTLLLLSDLALCDGFGQPCHEPRAEDFGLETGQLDWQRSFLRHRRYSPFNSKLKARECSRDVIAAGSVLTFTGCTLDEDGKSRLASGIGLHRQAGLGQVWINPPLLADIHPQLTGYQAGEAAAPVRPDHPLIHWLERCQAGNELRRRDRRLANARAKQLRKMYQAARRLNGYGPTQLCGPGASQWGRVLTVAKETGDGDAIRRKLFEGDSAVIKSNDEDWCIKVPNPEDDRSGIITFRDWLWECSRHEQIHDLGYVLATLARQAQDICRDASRDSRGRTA